MSGVAWAKSAIANGAAIRIAGSTVFLTMALSPPGGTRCCWVEQQFLHAPRGDFGYVDLVRIPAIHLMDAAEFLQRAPRLAEAAEHRAIQLHLVDLAGRRRAAPVVAGGEGVRAVQILMRPLRDADRPRRADVVVDRLQVQIVVQNLDARVAAVGHVRGT